MQTYFFYSHDKTEVETDILGFIIVPPWQNEVISEIPDFKSIPP